MAGVPFCRATALLQGMQLPFCRETALLQGMQLPFCRACNCPSAGQLPFCRACNCPSAGKLPFCRGGGGGVGGGVGSAKQKLLGKQFSGKTKFICHQDCWMQPYFQREREREIVREAVALQKGSCPAEGRLHALQKGLLPCTRGKGKAWPQWYHRTCILCSWLV
jgi:hypothetical protein